MNKECKTCEKVKSVEEFYKCNKAKDKLQSSCKSCKLSISRKNSNPVTVDCKECSKCRLSKSASEFRRNKSSKDGLRNECKECRYLQDREYRIRNKHKIYKSKKQYELENREFINKKRVERYHANLESSRSRRNFYESYRRRSQPKWALDYSEEWNAIYFKKLKMEKEDNKDYNIDHIIPVVHPDVCGLSVPWNYQILSKEENISKSNKFDGTYNNESWRKSWLSTLE